MAERGSSRKKVAEGDIILIHREGRAFLCKVLFASEVFRDVILLAVHCVDEPEKELVREGREPDLLIYTAGVCLSREGWAKVGFESVSDDERQLSRRIVGSEVWLEDQEIGPASAADRKRLPRM